MLAPHRCCCRERCRSAASSPPGVEFSFGHPQAEQEQEACPAQQLQQTAPPPSWPMAEPVQQQQQQDRHGSKRSAMAATLDAATAAEVTKRHRAAQDIAPRAPAAVTAAFTAAAPEAAALQTLFQHATTLLSGLPGSMLATVANAALPPQAVAAAGLGGGWAQAAPPSASLPPDVASQQQEQQRHVAGPAGAIGLHPLHRVQEFQRRQLAREQVGTLRRLEEHLLRQQVAEWARARVQELSPHQHLQLQMQMQQRRQWQRQQQQQQAAGDVQQVEGGTEGEQEQASGSPGEQTTATSESQDEVPRQRVPHQLAQRALGHFATRLGFHITGLQLERCHSGGEGRQRAPADQ